MNVMLLSLHRIYLTYYILILVKTAFKDKRIPPKLQKHYFYLKFLRKDFVVYTAPCDQIFTEKERVMVIFTKIKERTVIR